MSEGSPEFQKATGIITVLVCGYCFDTLEETVADLRDRTRGMKKGTESRFSEGVEAGWLAYWWTKDENPGHGCICDKCTSLYMGPPDGPDGWDDGPVASPNAPPAPQLMQISILAKDEGKADILFVLDNGETKPFRKDVDTDFIGEWVDMAWVPKHYI